MAELVAGRGQPYHIGVPGHWAVAPQPVCGAIEAAGKYEVLKLAVQ